jgi:hypothetical protein
MAVDEARRHRLYETVRERLGEEEAATLLEYLPPVGWADVATKRDLDALEARLQGDLDRRFGEVERQFGHVDARFGEIVGQFGEIDGRFGRIEGRFREMEVRFDEIDRQLRRVDGRFDGLDRRFGEINVRLDVLEDRMNAQTWKIVAFVTGAWFASLGFIRFA